MLVYHGFAEQGPDRRYHAGPVLQRTTHASASVAYLRQVARPHMELLVRETQESANLTVLSGTAVQFVLTVESARTLRVSDRAGASLPAHRTSGGKAILATLSEGDVVAIFAGVDIVDLDGLRAELAETRDQGFAINDQQTEAGITAVGMAIRCPDGFPPAAVSVAMPSARFSHARLPIWTEALRTAVQRVRRDLERLTVPDDAGASTEP